VVAQEGAMDAIEVLVELEEIIYHKQNIHRVEEHIGSDFLRLLHYRLSQKIKDNIGLTMKITIKDHNTIPRSEGGKLNRIMDLRKK